MVQVLHLMNRSADLQSARAADAIRSLAGPGVEITTRTLGRGGYYRSAAYAAAALRFGRGTLFDVVHAWDLPSLLAACGSPSPVVFSPSLPPAHRRAWLAAAMVYRNGTVIATTPAMQRKLVAQGIPAPRCQVIPPVLEFPPSSAPRDTALRMSLGISPDDRVIFAPGESSRAADHLLALHTVSILHVLDERTRLLVWGRGSCTKALERLAERLRQPRLLVVAEQRLARRVEFEHLLAVADLALISARGLAPAYPIALCMAAGLPIVGGTDSVTGDLLEDGRTASLTPKLAPRLLAQRVLHLLDDPASAARLGSAAAVEARLRFGPRQTVGEFVSLYRRLAGVSSKSGPNAEWLAEPHSSPERLTAG